MAVVLLFPPRLFLKMAVSLDSKYGTWLFFSTSALTHLPSTMRLVLMLMASALCTPSTCRANRELGGRAVALSVSICASHSFWRQSPLCSLTLLFLSLSLPAKSTMCRQLETRESFTVFLCAMLNTRTLCDRLLRSFMAVAARFLFCSASTSNSSMRGRLVTDSQRAPCRRKKGVLDG